MAALDRGFLTVHSQLEHIYRELVKPVTDVFGDDEQKSAKPAVMFDSKLYDELNGKLADCVSHAVKGKIYHSVSNRQL